MEYNKATHQYISRLHPLAQFFHQGTLHVLRESSFEAWIRLQGYGLLFARKGFLGERWGLLPSQRQKIRLECLVALVFLAILSQAEHGGGEQQRL